MKTLLALSIATLILPGLAAGQELIHEIHGSGPNAFLGLGHSFMGDVDGDGFEDFVVSAHGEQSLRLYSGQDGTVLAEALGVLHNGRTIAVGDLDGDGVTDFTMYGSPAVAVYSGATLTVIRTHLSPQTVSPTWPGVCPIGGGFGAVGTEMGDVSGDGVPDYVLTGPDANEGACFSGGAWLYSGSDGSILQSFLGDSEYLQLGRSATWIDDLDGDGFREVVLGFLSNAALPGTSFGGYRVYSSGTGMLLSQVDAPGPTYHGRKLEAVPDQNGDGVSDLAMVGVEVESVTSLVPHLTLGPRASLGCTGRRAEPRAGWRR